jgi:hypothetical protein
MSYINKCPAPEQLLAWLDGETEDELTAQHISECTVCREFISAVQEENEQLIAMLDAVPAPDLTGRVLAGIAEAERYATGLLNIFSYLVTVGVGFVLVLAYNFLPKLVDFQLRPVSVIKFFTALDRLVVFINYTMEYLADRILPGAPLIPPLVLVLVILFVNLLGKRRLSDV